MKKVYAEPNVSIMFSIVCDILAASTEPTIEDLWNEESGGEIL